jgi:hypothetical protein
MKTKQIILTALLFIGSSTIFSQINPIKNLSFGQHDNFMVQYDCLSQNCFSLSWNKPNSSLDTLDGYDVYRNNRLFAFTTDTVIKCWGNAPCLYPGFFENIFPSWVTVKAVYNKDSLRSTANDSVYVSDIAMNITQSKKESFYVLKNPTKIGENISLFIPANVCSKSNIKVFSQNGQLIKQYVLGNNFSGVINISTYQLSRGLYIINLQLDNKTLTTKIIIE